MDKDKNIELHIQEPLLSDIKSIIEQGRQRVAVSINSEMTMMYWQIGHRINEEVLQNNRAPYGKEIVATLSRQLQTLYGEKSFTEKNLRRMMQFASVYKDAEIVATLLRQLPWSHFTLIIPIEDELKRKFYEQMAIHEHWSVRTLKSRIDSMLYERTAISKKPEETIANELQILETEQKMSPDLAFRDPYLLDFLGLHDTYSEKDLENAILQELQNFIVEMGSDFAFMGRQRRVTIDNEDYYIDLLFYHRRLRCLVAIDLKLDSFKAAYKGQMELYLNWLKKYEMAEGENYPIGLILCSGKNEEHIELMHLDDSNIRVAEYMTKLPDRALLEQKLQQAIERARNRFLNSAQP